MEGNRTVLSLSFFLHISHILQNAPQICRDFPDNPLAVLPDRCGYRAWKDEINPIALMLHSMVEIVDFYKKKLQEVL